MEDVVGIVEESRRKEGRKLIRSLSQVPSPSPPSLHMRILIHRIWDADAALHTQAAASAVDLVSKMRVYPSHTLSHSRVTVK